MAVAADEIKGPIVAKCGRSDLVQETLIEAHTDPAARRRDGAAVKGWLRGILRRKAINCARKFRNSAKRTIRRELSLDVPGDASSLVFQLADPEPTPSTRAAQAEEYRLLDAAIETLPPDERLVILYHSRDRLSWDEVGGRMNRSPEAARKLWGRAVVRLQDHMKKKLADDL
jgi:RNA polymerase sigma-70 factor (ECF subfamily)